jgi:hypothetical protein
MKSLTHAQNTSACIGFEVHTTGGYDEFLWIVTSCKTRREPDVSEKNVASIFRV